MGHGSSLPSEYKQKIHAAFQIKNTEAWRNADDLEDEVELDDVNDDDVRVEIDHATSRAVFEAEVPHVQLAECATVPRGRPRRYRW